MRIALVDVKDLEREIYLIFFFYLSILSGIWYILCINFNSVRQQAVCYILDIFQEMSSHLCFEHLCWHQVPTILKHLRADWFVPQYAVVNFQFHPQHWDQGPAMVQYRYDV